MFDLIQADCAAESVAENMAGEADNMAKIILADLPGELMANRYWLWYAEGLETVAELVPQAAARYDFGFNPIARGKGAKGDYPLLYPMDRPFYLQFSVGTEGDSPLLRHFSDGLAGLELNHGYSLPYPLDRPLCRKVFRVLSTAEHTAVEVAAWCVVRQVSRLIMQPGNRRPELIVAHVYDEDPVWGLMAKGSVAVNAEYFVGA